VCALLVLTSLRLLPVLAALHTCNLSRGVAAAGAATLTELLSKQPTAMLSTLDALVRSRAEAEAANKVYARRMQLFQAPPGVYIPELIQLNAQLVTYSMSLYNKSEPKPAAAAAQAVLRHPTTAGAAWVGLLVTAQKYALRALHQAPNMCAWEVAASAVLQMLALHVLTAAAVDMPLIATSAAQLSFMLPVVWTIATDAAKGIRYKIDADALLAKAVVAGKAAGDSSSGSDSDDDSDRVDPGTGYVLLESRQYRAAIPAVAPLIQEMAAEEAAEHGAAAARKLGPLLLPVVQLYCRALLLLTKVLVLGPDVLAPGSGAIRAPACTRQCISTSAAAPHQCLSRRLLLLPPMSQCSSWSCCCRSCASSRRQQALLLLPAAAAAAMRQQRRLSVQQQCCRQTLLRSCSSRQRPAVQPWGSCMRTWQQEQSRPHQISNLLLSVWLLRRQHSHARSQAAVGQLTAGRACWCSCSSWLWMFWRSCRHRSCVPTPTAQP
jgi:hypothetical protein